MTLKEVSVLLFLLSLCHVVVGEVNEGETDADIMKYYAVANMKGADPIESDSDMSNNDADIKENADDVMLNDDGTSEEGEMMIRGVMDLTELRGRPKSGTFSNSWKSLTKSLTDPYAGYW